MKINKVSYNNPSFTRAFSTKENIEYKKLEADTRDELGLEETSVIFFDFNAPSERGKNYGIGTLNSPYSAGFVDFLKNISSISKIQAAPQSELAYYSDGKTFAPVTSPYSGSTFTLGRQTISLDKLTSKSYARILDEGYITSLDENYPGSKTEREYKTDYTYALGTNKDGVIFKSLQIAYNNFLSKLENGDSDAILLNEEYQKFKDNMSLDMKKDIYFEVLSDFYHSQGKKGAETSEWSETDRNLFSSSIDNETREKRLKELDKASEIYKFSQFIAYKQHGETKDELNKKGIKLFGDCLVCFSPKEVWANPSCFLKTWYTGGKDPFCQATKGIQPWGSPALNFSKLGEYDKDGNIVKLGETGELLYRKFKNFMELYDGVRMDAFWQYVSPFIYNSNLTGKDIEGIDDKIIKIMEKAANETEGKEFTPDKFVLELIGFNTEKGKALTINRFPHVYSTAFAEYNENPKDLVDKQGYEDGYFIIGTTSHDNDSLVNMSRNEERKRCHFPILKHHLKEGMNHLAYNSQKYMSMSAKQMDEQDFRTAKTAEIFTAKKQYYTLPDLFGMSERINISGQADNNNWLVRIPTDYERFYHTQLANGYGINFPKAYEVALYAKGSKNTNLLKKLKEASEILASEGPMTSKEADIEERKGTLGKTFVYDA